MLSSLTLHRDLCGSVCKWIALCSDADALLKEKNSQCPSITMNGQEKIIERRPGTRDLPHTQIASHTETRKHQEHKNNALDLRSNNSLFAFQQA